MKRIEFLQTISFLWKTNPAAATGSKILREIKGMCRLFDLHAAVAYLTLAAICVAFTIWPRQP
jgi:hypothetical protein